MCIILIWRARSATQSMIPTKTGAAAAVGLVMPELNGKLDGFAIRVPTTNVSIVDLVFNTNKSSSVNELNNLVLESSENQMRGIVGYNNLPLVSRFNHSSFSSVYDESSQGLQRTNYIKFALGMIMSGDFLIVCLMLLIIGSSSAA